MCFLGRGISVIRWNYPAQTDENSSNSLCGKFNHLRSIMEHHCINTTFNSDHFIIREKEGNISKG